MNKIEALLTRIAEDETLPKLAKELFARYRQDYARLQVAIEKIEAKLMAWHKHNELSRRLVKIPSIGPIGASLLVMKVTDPHAFRSGRDFSAWIGLTPKDHSTAGKTRLGVITRAGDEALRSVLVVGATAVIQQVQRGKGGSPWLVELLKRKAPKEATVALANKTARIVWKLMTTGGHYHPTHASAQAPLARRRRNAPPGYDEGITNSTRDKHLPLRPELARDEQMVRSIDPKRETLRGIQWHSKPNRCLELARGNHLGQRSCATAPKGRTYDRKRSDQPLLRLLQAGGRPHMDSRVRARGA